MKTRSLYQERAGWAWWVHLLVSITLVAVVIPLMEALNGNIGSGPGEMPVWVALLCAVLYVLLPKPFHRHVLCIPSSYPNNLHHA